MKNVKVKIEDNKLILEVDLDQDFGASASGKTTIIGSSEGNQTVPDADYSDVKFGLNVYKSR